MASFLDNEAVCEDIEVDELIDDVQTQSDNDFIDDEEVDDEDGGIYLSSQIFERENSEASDEARQERPLVLRLLIAFQYRQQ